MDDSGDEGVACAYGVDDSDGEAGVEDVVFAGDEQAALGAEGEGDELAGGEEVEQGVGGFEGQGGGGTVQGWEGEETVHGGYESCWGRGAVRVVVGEEGGCAAEGQGRGGGRGGVSLGSVYECFPEDVEWLGLWFSA